MTWFKLDDQWLRHPKVRAAGLEGRALWIAGGLWSASQLTDGRIIKTMLPILAAEAEVPPATSDALVAAGLWHDHGDHWQMHDWHDWQPTREQVINRREQATSAAKAGARKRWSDARDAEPHSEPLSEPHSEPQRDRIHARHAPDPTRPDRGAYAPPPPPTPSMPTPRVPDGAGGGGGRTFSTDQLDAIEATVQRLVDIEQERAALTGRPVQNPQAWRRQVARRIRTEHGDALADHAHAGTDPRTAALTIAGWAPDGPTPDDWQALTAARIRWESSETPAESPRSGRTGSSAMSGADEALRGVGRGAA